MFLFFYFTQILLGYNSWANVSATVKPQTQKEMLLVLKNCFVKTIVCQNYKIN